MGTATITGLISHPSSHTAAGSPVGSMTCLSILPHDGARKGIYLVEWDLHAIRHISVSGSITAVGVACWVITAAAHRVHSWVRLGVTFLFW